MSQVSRPVFEAIERWQAKSLITDELAERLRGEVVEASEAGTARMSQYLVAATGAVVLLIASGVFLDWAWPRMDDAMRTAFLLAVGLGVHLWGARLETVRRWIPAALLMQTAGLGLLMVAFVYSEEAWADVSAGGIATGIGALLVPFALAPRSFRANAVMPAVHLCFALGFIAVFLDRATPLVGDTIIWVLDGVLLVASAVMVAVLRRDPGGTRHPWALNAFVAAVYAAAVLVFVTAAEALTLGDDVAYALDLWLFLVAGLTLWGIHRSPPGLRKDWFEDQLAYCVLLWIPLGFFTAMEAMDGTEDLALVMVGSGAVAGFAYALRYRVRRVLVTSALAFIAAVWVWAAERGGALGAVAGLAFAAGLLFWLSGRVGRWTGAETGREG
ncbi:MAG: hypothetical protein AMXMBFR53_00790 [Gemmatimonadota bacterium]